MGSNEKPLSHKAFNDQRPWGSTKRRAMLPWPPRGSRGPHCRTGGHGCWLLCAVREVQGKTETPHSSACKSGRASQKSWCQGAEKLRQCTGKSCGHLRGLDINKAQGQDRRWLSAGPLLGGEWSYCAFLLPGCWCHQVRRPQFSLLLCHSPGPGGREALGCVFGQWVLCWSRRAAFLRCRVARSLPRSSSL